MNKYNITREEPPAKEDEEIKGYHPDVRILIKGGLDEEWAAASEQKDLLLLEGEICYATDVKINEHEGVSILKIGNGIDNWGSLGISEKNGQYDNSVFFGGRGAGILPASHNDSLKSPLGAIRLHNKSGKKDGLSIDNHGFLSLWKENNRTVLEIDELTAGILHAKKMMIDETYQTDVIILRTNSKEGNKEPGPLLDGQYSGITVRKYDDKYNSTLGINNMGEWGVIKSLEDGLSFTYESEFQPFLFASTNLPDGPMLWDAREKRIKEWHPNTFVFKINDEADQIYKPYTTMDNEQLPVIRMKTLTSIEIETRNAEQGEIPTDNIYKIDESGKIKIILPILTGNSIDNWNKKVDSIILKGDNLSKEKNGVYSAEIPVDDSTYDRETKTINAPIHTISRNNKNLPIENYNVNIQTDTYDLTFKGDSYLKVTSEKVVDPNDENHFIFKLTAKHDKKKVEDKIPQTYYIGHVNNSVPYLSFYPDEYGHVNQVGIVYYSFERVLDKIDELEKKIQALEAQLVNK